MLLLPICQNLHKLRTCSKTNDIYTQKCLGSFHIPFLTKQCYNKRDKIARRKLRPMYSTISFLSS